MPISMETSAWGAMIAAAEGAVMLVVMVLLLAEVASVESRKRLLH